MGAAYKHWSDVLKSIEADDPNTKEWYMIRVGGYDRSAFMTRERAIVYIKQIIAKA